MGNPKWIVARSVMAGAMIWSGLDHILGAQEYSWGVTILIAGLGFAILSLADADAVGRM